MNRVFFDRVIKVLCGAAAAALTIPFWAVPVSAEAYSGITIDGDFSDWDSVVKYDAPNDPNQPAVNQCSIIWDGDYIYIYLDEVQQNSASWAGPNHNGNFNIKTDIGEVLMIAVHNNGVEGNTVEVTNPKTNTYLSSTNGGLEVAFNSEYSVWGAPTLTEIKIPSSVLPQYSSTINFGYYEGDNIICDVADASQLSHGDPDPDTPTPEPTEAPYNDGTGIVIDGDYYDWDYYPVTTIEYDTAGTLNDYADAKGSIYSSDGIAKVHCVANYFEYADTGYDEGAEFLQVTVIFGYTHSKLIAVAIDDNGNLDWSTTEVREQSKGTHKYALFYFADSRQTTNISDINPQDHYLGDMYVTVGDYQDETEFWFDVGALAECAGVDPSDCGRIKVHFHRVGKRMLECSGVSTGPVFVALLSTVAAGSYLTLNRRKKKAE